MTEITLEIAKKVLDTVNAGLTPGLGNPVPGQMCVEAAVCYAMGLPHGDNPSCVAQSLRLFKLGLNDAPWSSNQARAVGMRRLALAQLGSAGSLNQKDFEEKLVILAQHWIKSLDIRLLYTEADYYSYSHYAVEVAKDVAYFASKKRPRLVSSSSLYDETLARCAEDVVQLLVSLDVPGAQWLTLAPLPTEEIQ